MVVHRRMAAYAERHDSRRGRQAAGISRTELRRRSGPRQPSRPQAVDRAVACAPRAGSRARGRARFGAEAPAPALRRSFVVFHRRAARRSAAYAVARLQLVFAQENAIDYPESTLIACALSSDEGPSELLLSLDMRIEHFAGGRVPGYLARTVPTCRRPDRGSGRLVTEAVCLSSATPCSRSMASMKPTSALSLATQRDRRIGGVPLEPLTLTRNFRSRQGAGRLGERCVFPMCCRRPTIRHEGQLAFQPAAATPPTARPMPQSPSTSAPTPCGRRVGSRCRECAARSRARATNVAVLVRKRGDLADILPALRAKAMSHLQPSSSIASRNGRPCSTCVP